ncbi:DNA-binding transcriptional regulator, AcrR family [Halolactibacillus halophilus]|uniref:DNA-binding transcriptional regulator, AcrR family n=1 Tax=Halolactibacillus halophilus TaxID=306540 RepID=A0A1I5P323_9BACI|nr:TetR/AcrR family transcriptional regulator [Halolactibacillus halophilus]GEM01514.1 TetR family transcriptional regulator [Halolactibacillus halophilus]SFP28363.1 DNA-binding transcriptional regulator, AcrR family [Halolactibacillus halophilus]
METKQAIMTGAFQLFAVKGLAFSMSEVADYAGIKKASIYAHFASKEKLLKEVIETESEGYFLLNTRTKDLKTVFFDILTYHREDPKRTLFWKRLLILPPEAMDQVVMNQIETRLQNRFQHVRELIKRESKQADRSDEEVETLTVMFFSLVHGLLSSELIYTETDLSHMYEGIWQQFMINMSH